MFPRSLSAHAPLILGVALLATPLVWTGVRLLQPRQQLVEQVSRELPQRSGELLELEHARLAKLGPAGLAALLEQFDADENPDALARAEAAFEVVRSELSLWRRLSVPDSSRRVATLSEQLAELEYRTERARKWAAALAEEMLDWPLDRAQVRATDVVANCDVVLRRAVDNALLSKLEPEPLEVAEAPVLFDTRSQLEPRADLARRESPQPDLIRTQPRALLDGRGASELDPASEPRDFEPGGEAVSDKPAPSFDPPVGEPGVPTDLTELPQLEVIKYLAAQDPLDRLRALHELQRRGFTEGHLQFARQLVDPDPVIRRTAANRVTRVVGLDTRNWLLWLTKDPDSEVRQIAISTIATSNDPVLRKQLQLIQMREPDPEVLRAVQRILDARR